MEASRRLVCVFVECGWGLKNKDLSGKFQIRGYPTVIFCDPDGNEVARLGDREPSSVAAMIEEVVKKYDRSRFDRFDAAAEKGREAGKPVLYLFTKRGAPGPLAAALDDSSLKDLLEKFVVAVGEASKENPDAKALSLTDSAILVLDPGAELKARPVLKLTGKKDAKEVRKQLEAALRKYEESERK